MFFRRPKPQQQPFKVIRAIQAVYNRGNRIGIPRSNDQKVLGSVRVILSSVGTLYVIGTPIGNLGDLTLRASRILSSVPLVAAEDTRVTRRLLAHLDAHPRLLSCHEHNWKRQLPRLLEALDEGDVALATDAGSPAISDPGAGLVAAVAEAGHSVVTIPGVSAVTAALSTLVLFESPHRLRATLTDIADALNDPPIAVCRELTKLHEEVWRGTASDALAYFAAPRGEFTVVIGPVTLDAPDQTASQDELLQTARHTLAEHRAAGKRGRDAVAEVVASTGLPRRAVYALWVETGSSDSGNAGKR
ncbi:Ribosomal RNA small subunit methyltransferase I [Geodia barretti]|uniref:Ribosomal RNA small subunit methyltransferase I n=1 Tax=Geodia barretti TaxID=519541 RepID=A0AA35X8U6_GEOBA|nr:Ribosomal RNA small subunit methyltransferase I [Geodia barretti]